jgi:purine-nucleoside phosphorylase
METLSVNLYDRVQETVAAIRGKTTMVPSLGVILGTGLGGLGEGLEAAQRIGYEQIPHFPRSTVEGHGGRFIFGRVGGKSAVVMEGRFHLYEGYTAEQVAYPVRVMQALGVKTLLVSNAAGGLNPAFAAGDLMLITDHINLMGVNPLIGPNDERLGIRFPDMSAPYEKLCVLAGRISASQKLTLRRGVYAAVAGPNLETRAEYRFLKTIGADAVGMSTIPEVIVAVHAKMRVLAFSCITDLCDPDHLKPATVEEIIRVANAAGPKLAAFMTRVIEEL